MDEALTQLREVFGYEHFRPGQEEVISAILRGQDVLAVMPTGAGKSLCYQVPALVLPGITLVISPLISLMHDQVNALMQNGVHAAYLNSALTPRQHKLVLKNARLGVYKILYVAPERLSTETFLSFAQEATLSQIVIDEAHCVSQWGQDFRPGYLQINPFIRSLPVRPRVSAFTATATERVKRDITRLLGLLDPFELTTGFDRPNLFFEVRRPVDRDAELLRFLRAHREQSGIIYCGTRKGVEEVTRMLGENGIAAVGYHAGMDDMRRQAAQEDFVNDKAPVIVATNAFGMGIDKSNVSFVVHYNMPKDIESYYQEAGRAGRDGESAVCCLLYQPQDVRLNTYLIEHAQSDAPMDEKTRQAVQSNAKERLRQMTFYATSRSCLRARILEYFGEKPVWERCGNCSVCLAGIEQRDVTREAGQIVSAVIALGGRYGKALTAQMLSGKMNERVRSKGLNTNKSFGILAQEGEDNVRAIIDELIACEALQVTGGEYPLLKPGPRAREVLRGDEPIRIPLKPRGASNMPRGAKNVRPAVNERLFARLSALRRRIASEQRVPPFIIFSNMTLRDMAVKRPATREEMLRVDGVGEWKFAHYGSAFLAEIARFEEEDHD